MRIKFCLLFTVVVIASCRGSFLANIKGNDMNSEYMPAGWEKVKSGEQGSIEAFKAAMQGDGASLGLNNEPDDGTPNGSLDNVPPLSNGAPSLPGPIEAQHAFAYKTSKKESIALKIGAKIGPAGVTSQGTFSFNKETAVRVWIYGDNIEQPLWQQSKLHPEGFINLKSRKWVAYQCGVVVAINSDDHSSIDVNAGGDYDIAGLGLVTISASGTSTTDKTTSIENIFTRLSTLTVVKSADLPAGQTDGPAHNDILKSCVDFAQKPAVQAAIDTDIAVRASRWRYVNANTVCLKDSECTEWHQEIIGSVQAWTVPRCVRIAKAASKDSFYTCRMKSKSGGACTLPGRPRGPFEYPCDVGLTCSPLSKGALWWKETYGECQ